MKAVPSQGKRVEMFVVVGDQNEINHAAELWHFTEQGFKLDKANPVDTPRAAAATPLDAVSAGWTTDTDAERHAAAVSAIPDENATPFVHFPQRDPAAAIDLHKSGVLPKLH